MQLPRLNLNGSHGPTLVAQYRAALEAVSNAIVHVQQIDVHGRDYILLDSNAASVAFAEHRARLDKLRQIERELAAVAVELDDQIAERAKR
jgi:hypothetical protein